MRHARAPIVSDEPKVLEAEVAHYLDHIPRHRSLRICGVLGVGLGLARIAVATQVRTDDGVVRREPWGDAMPHRMRLRIAVQQKERWTASTHDAMNAGRGRRDVARGEFGKEHAPLLVHRAGANRYPECLRVAGRRGACLGIDDFARSREYTPGFAGFPPYIVVGKRPTARQFA
jgi:hypothetical protein